MYELETWAHHGLWPVQTQCLHFQIKHKCMVQELEWISLPASVLLCPSTFCFVPHKVECVVCMHCDSERRGHHISHTYRNHHGPVVQHSAGNSVSSVVVWWWSELLA